MSSGVAVGDGDGVGVGDGDAVEDAVGVAAIAGDGVGSGVTSAPHADAVSAAESRIATTGRLIAAIVGAETSRPRRHRG
jgi:hypothetical protein